MSVLFVSRVTILNEEKLNQYLQAVRPLASQRGAEMKYMAKFSKEITETPNHDMLVVVEFPDEKSVTDLFESEEYQKLIPTREAGSKQEISIYKMG
jgi:uncharacterized protein (DUF1330 family)